MKINAKTPTGDKQITLTQSEIEKLAELGDNEAKKEILKQEIAAAVDIQGEVNAIKKFLGI